MKQPEDNLTIDAFEGRGRGRPLVETSPRTPEEKRRAAAKRKQEQRARLRAAGVETMTVELGADVMAALRASPRVKMEDETLSQAVARILRNQLLRKR